MQRDSHSSCARASRSLQPCTKLTASTRGRIRVISSWCAMSHGSEFAALSEFGQITGREVNLPRMFAPPPVPITSAQLTQTDTALQLVVETKARDVCVVIGPKRLCVDGRTLTGAPDSTVTRDGNALTATFTPANAGVPFGKFQWVVEAPGARWPATGALAGRARLLAQPKCFGAVARDPWRPCTNPDLRLTVTPSPAQALLVPNAPCTPTTSFGLVRPCEFGVARGEPVALIGDSHAEHWRAALDVVAQAKRWRGISIIRTGCPFSAVVAPLVTAALTQDCARWISTVPRWLKRHPEIHTLFVSARSPRTFTADAYVKAWKRLPASIRRIYVLRDTPHIVKPQAGCVSKLLRAHRPIGWRCSQPRGLDLRPDVEAE